MRLLLLIALCLTIPTTYARGGNGKGNTPCSKSKGGVNHCEGAKYICNDGSTSKSKTSCSSSDINAKSTADSKQVSQPVEKPKQE